ncbi:lysozyme inhibitor LprI family protein [Escherichia coli]|uniref:lysozyme inhibitor LprI family protein n=1 Tax=Escherichia coli TaxID=562 RepID=UPI000A1894FD|nr:putative secreted protein [Escherichia coli T426]
MERTVTWSCLSLLLMVSGVSAASFDCRQAELPDEKAICADRHLSDLDVEMAVKFHFLKGLMAMGKSGEMSDSQQVWLKNRQSCKGDVGCLNRQYQQRIAELDALYAGIEKTL